jgi:hypothetical protein
MQSASTSQPTRPSPTSTPDEDAIRVLVARLSRPHRSGGDVIERATILAEGGGAPAVLSWIAAHGGQPESEPAPVSRGLHGARFAEAASAASSVPRRYVLPAGALR